jgi:hypothetical protein
LRNLAADNEHNQRAISACHGIEAIVAAMEMHIAVAGVVEQGCSALCNLAFRELNKNALAHFPAYVTFCALDREP